MVLFLSGMLLAEIDLIAGTWDAPSNASPVNEEGQDQVEKCNEPPSARSQLKWDRVLWLCIFAVGLFIGSAPNESQEHTPGYRYLFTYVPKSYPENHRFLQSVGAIIIVCCINHSKDLQKGFTNELAQYFGHISFAFYIVHGPILHSLGYSLMPGIWQFTGKETDFQYCIGLFIGWLVCFPISIWVADIFWRAVDLPAVRFTRWFERRLM
jgi:peptidoglycan/LPS O-acetylase OafA/YrhL